MSKREKFKRTVSTPRVITGLALGLVIIALLALGNDYAAYLFFAIAILGSYEIGKISFPGASSIIIYLHVLLGALPYILLNHFDPALSEIKWLFYVNAGIFLLLVLDLFRKAYLPYRKISFLMAALYWGLSFGLSAYYLHLGVHDMSKQFMGIIFVLWTSDTMAYVFGRKFGKNKLFPRISPGKTIEGSIGAGVSSIVLALVVSIILQEPLLKWLCLALVIWIVGTGGDLVESKIKRAVQVKDSGDILPGHGGILDRFDSLALALPFIILILEYLS